MIIRGNTVGTTQLCPDYAQTDPNRVDYIRNKPDAAIASAQQTADTAKAAAEAALHRAGGTMTGVLTMGATLDMGGNRLSNVANPEEDSDGVNRGYLVSYADGRRLKATVIAAAALWEGEGPYTQTVNVAGMLFSDLPHFGPVYSADADTRLAEKEAFAMVDELGSSDGSVTFTCFEDKPEVDLTIQL